MLEKILVCFHFLLLEYGVYFTFYSEKRWGCLLLAGITFGIPLLGGMFRKRFGFLLIGMLSEISVLLLAGNIVELIIFTFFVVVMVVAYTIQSAFGNENFFMRISLIWILFLLCCHIPLKFTGYPGQKSLQILGVCYVILYLLHLANENMRNFKKLHSRLEKLPMVQLGKNFFMSVSAVVLWVVFGMLLGRNERAADYLGARLNDLMDHLGGSAIKIAPDGIQGTMAHFMVDYTGDPYKQGTELPKHSYEMNQLLEHIFNIVLIVLLMLLVLFLVYFLYCYLKRDRKDEGDVVEFIKKEEEVSSLYQEHSKKQESKREQSPNAIVRKLYKKKIKSSMKTRIPYWATPYELEELAEWVKKGNESVLHNLYEKARYSKDGCLKEDLDRYKLIDEKYHKHK